MFRSSKLSTHRRSWCELPLYSMTLPRGLSMHHTLQTQLFARLSRILFSTGYQAVFRISEGVASVLDNSLRALHSLSKLPATMLVRHPDLSYTCTLALLSLT